MFLAFLQVRQTGDGAPGVRENKYQLLHVFMASCRPLHGTHGEGMYIFQVVFKLFDSFTSGCVSGLVLHNLRDRGSLSGLHQNREPSR